MLGDMDIKERIANIKKILPYCSHWSNEVMIVDEQLLSDVKYIKIKQDDNT